MPNRSEQAETLLGPCSRKDESGGVRVTYTSASGRLETFSNGRFSAELTPGLFPTGTSDPLVHALEMLKLLGVTAELTAREQRTAPMFSPSDRCGRARQSLTVK